MNAFCMSTTINAVLVGSMLSNTCSRPRFAMTRSMIDCGMEKLCMGISAGALRALCRWRDGRAICHEANLNATCECIGNECVRERITVAGRGLIVHRPSRHTDCRIGGGMDADAQDEQRPACSGLRHLRLECKIRE